MEYTKSNYSNKVWLPLNLIRTAMDGDWLNSLCYLVWFKKLYRNGTIYNYSHRKAARLLGTSPSTISHHVSILQSKGLISFHHGNMTYVGANKLKEYGFIVAVKVSSKRDEQREQLRYTAIKRNLHSQIREHGKKSAIIKMQKQAFTPKDDFKAIRKLIKRYGANPEKTTTDKLMLSNGKFGKLCNRSASTGRRIKRKLSMMGVISTKKNIIQVFNQPMNRKMFFAGEYPSKYFLNRDGYMCLQLPDEIKRMQ